MWIYKGRKIILLKVKDEKSHFAKCKGCFEQFFHVLLPKIYESGVEANLFIYVSSSLYSQ